MSEQLTPEQLAERILMEPRPRVLMESVIRAERVYSDIRVAKEREAIVELAEGWEERFVGHHGEMDGPETLREFVAAIKRGEHLQRGLDVV